MTRKKNVTLQKRYCVLSRAVRVSIRLSRSFVGNRIFTIIRDIHIYNNDQVLAGGIRTERPN